MTASATEIPKAFTRPSDLLWLSEPWRASADIAAYWASLPSLLTGPTGDGRPVLVIPGLLADDSSTLALRTVLTLRGHPTHPWRLGPNLGPVRSLVDGAFDALDELYVSSGTPVTVIGQSLGGFFARQLARLRPNQVRQVITLGTPLRLRLEDDPGLSRVGHLFDALRPWHSDFFAHVPHEEDMPRIAQPVTSIYSKVDGVVPWEACLTPEGPTDENVEVHTSHAGMGFHPHALRVVLDRLAQTPADWQPWSAAKN